MHVSTISISNKRVTHQSIMNDIEHKYVLPSISSTRSHNSFLSRQVGHLETKRKSVFELKSFCNRIQKRRSGNLSAARDGSLVNRRDVGQSTARWRHGWRRRSRECGGTERDGERGAARSRDGWRRRWRWSPSSAERGLSRSKFWWVNFGFLPPPLLSPLLFPLPSVTIFSIGFKNNQILYCY